jgi:hypothetical protein
MVPTPSQITVVVCNQITLLILYYISSRLLTLLKVNDALKQGSDIFYLTVSFKFISFSLFLILIPEMSTSFTPYIAQIIYTALVGILQPVHFSLLIVIKNHKHSSSNYGLCSFNSFRPTLSQAEVLIFSFNIFQGLFMSSLPFKISRAANLFEILIWYCFLTCSSLASWD